MQESKAQPIRRPDPPADKVPGRTPIGDQPWMTGGLLVAGLVCTLAAGCLMLQDPAAPVKLAPPPAPVEETLPAQPGRVMPQGTQSPPVRNDNALLDPKITQTKEPFAPRVPQAQNTALEFVIKPRTPAPEQMRAIRASQRANPAHAMRVVGDVLGLPERQLEGFALKRISLGDEIVLVWTGENPKGTSIADWSAKLEARLEVGTSVAYVDANFRGLAKKAPPG